MKIIQFLKSRTFLIQLGLFVILLFLSYFGVFGGLESYTRHSETVQVPKLYNLQMEEVQNELDALGLRYRIIDSSEYNVNVNRGAVIEVFPKAGNLVKPERELLLTVNPITPEKVVVPDVIDKSKRQAMEKLRFSGLNIGTLTYVPDMAKDVVLSMKCNGEVVEPGQELVKLSTVDLVLGKGLSNERIIMPYVVGLPLNEAAYKLKSFSLNTGALNFDDSVAPEDSLNAFVYKQRPYASLTPKIRMGADVDLWLTMDTNKVVLDTLYSQLR